MDGGPYASDRRGSVLATRSPPLLRRWIAPILNRVTQDPDAEVTPIPNGEMLFGSFGHACWCCPARPSRTPSPDAGGGLQSLRSAADGSATVEYGSRLLPVKRWEELRPLAGTGL